MERAIKEKKKYSGSKYRTIALSLREQVTSGRLRGMLPGAGILAAQYGVTLMTANRAVNELAMEGLVDRRPNVGTFVSQTASVRTHTIAVVVADITLPLTARIMNALSGSLQQQQIKKLVYTHGEKSEVQFEILNAICADRLADGIIWIPAAQDDYLREMKLLKNAGVPCVALGVESLGSELQDDTAVVGADYFSAVYELSRHLIGQGARRIVYMSESQVSSRRFQGLAQAVSEAAQMAYGVIMPNLDACLDGDPKALEEFRAALSSYDAILCQHDRFTIKVLKLLKQLGISVPRDLLCASIDDLDVAAVAELTSYRLPMETIARTAGEILLAMIESKPAAKRVEIKGELVVRRSSQPCPNGE
jgi:DNA-binding LacI/PurR family transcriptional regulator